MTEGIQLTHRSAPGPGFLARASKAVGALLGGATAPGVAYVLALFGVELPPDVLGVLVGALAIAGTYLAPPNK